MSQYLHQNDERSIDGEEETVEVDGDIFRSLNENDAKLLSYSVIFTYKFFKYRHKFLSCIEENSLFANLWHFVKPKATIMLLSKSTLTHFYTAMFSMVPSNFTLFLC